jgi:tetratricopeptide (TPR) repeat protein
MAIDMYQRAIAINNNNTEAHLALGEIYANQESLEKAIEEFKVAMDQNPDNSAIPMNISILLYNNKKYQEAIPYIQKTLEMEGPNKDMYELLSLSYMQMAQKHLDEYQETEDEESAKKAIQIYEEALPTLEKAVQEFPDSALLWNNLGVCYAQTGNKDKAEEAFEKQQQLEESE